MALPQGINFRQTSGYVTDGTDEHGDTIDSYPFTTAQGNNVGWESGSTPSARNRSTGVDVRLAGIHFLAKTSTATYRIDLPSSGDYNVSCAAGDATSANNVELVLIDDATTLTTLVASQFVTGGNFRDATDTGYTSANWPGSNSTETHTFSSTILRLQMGGTSGSGNNVVAHFKVEAAGGGGGATPRCRTFTGPFYGAIGGAVQ